MRILKTIFIIFSFLLLINFTNAVCCEKTKDGGICLNVGNANYCDSNFRIEESTSCSSTQYCSKGTCVNQKDGTCMESTSAACDPLKGGYWVDKDSDDVEECKLGCCLIGDGAALVERIKCNEMSSQRGIEPDFRENVLTQEECLNLAGPKKQGACVYQDPKGRKCNIKTREECALENKEFYEGKLCSAPELGTICTMTEKTMCVEGKNEVYFQDNCGNPANVYDSDKVKDVNYWTYIKEVSESCGANQSNVNSATCGNCNYLLGTVCGDKKLGTTVDYGNYICKDLSCTDKTGRKRAHGESWCSEPIGNFEEAKVGQLSYRLYCYNGEIEYELCGNQREKLCKEDTASKSAFCIVNKWQDCVMQTNEKDCENIEKRDCKVFETIIRYENGTKYTLLDENGNKKNAICLPKYSPGFNFWEQDTNILGVEEQISPIQVCNIGTISSLTGYRELTALSKWRAYEGVCFKKCVEECEGSLTKMICEEKCFHECESSDSLNDQTNAGKLGNVTIKEDWALNKQELCSSLGDCGVKADYMNGNGYFSWKDLFLGDGINKDSISNIGSYR